MATSGEYGCSSIIMILFLYKNILGQVTMCDLVRYCGALFLNLQMTLGVCSVLSTHLHPVVTFLI